MSAVRAPRPLLARVLTFALVLLGAYAAACIAMFVLQDRFVWFPSRAIVAAPDQFGMPYEDVHMTASDGVSLHGWLVPPPAREAQGDARRAVLFCHGNAGNVSNCIGVAQAFHKLGYTVLLFDYRGYGLSEGAPSEIGTYLDARAAWTHLTEEGFAKEDIAIVGQSLGGAVAAHLAREVEAPIVVVENTFTSAGDLGAEQYRVLPVRWLLRSKYPTLDNLVALGARTLVIHTPGDEIVPYRHGERIFAALSAPKEMLVTGGGHNDGGFLQRPAWRASVGTFLETSFREVAR